jgi:hypothetical protein
MAGQQHCLFVIDSDLQTGALIGDRSTDERRILREAAFKSQTHQSCDQAIAASNQRGLWRMLAMDGGRDRDRTCDPLDVNEVLSR